MRKTTFAAIFSLLVLGTLSGATLAQSSAASNQGWIYGTVETRSGNEYTGTLRWGTEEAFWDDLFNSSKEDLPYWDSGPRERRRRAWRRFPAGEEFFRRWHPTRL